MHTKKVQVLGERTISTLGRLHAHSIFTVKNDKS